MFCIMSKNKNGTESAIAYFDTFEKAEDAIPLNAMNVWYVKEVGELRPFLDSLKISNKAKYVKVSEPEPVTVEEKKVQIFDTEKELKDHMVKALTTKKAKKTVIKVPPEIEEIDDKPILSKTKANKYKAYHRISTKDIKPKEPKQTIRHLDPVKKYDYPTEENGKDYFRYSYYFFEITSTPTLSKSYGGMSYSDRIIVQEGDIYKNKGFRIILYDLSEKQAEKRMKEKLNELKKKWK